MRLYDRILQHKLSANLLMLMLLLIGIICFLNINRQLFPSFQLPIINASISWDNADAQSIYEQIGSKADAAIQQLEGISFSRSLNQNGQLQMTIIADSQSDINVLQDEIDNSLQALALPEGASVDTVSSRQLNEAVSSLVLFGPIVEEDLYQLSMKMQQSLLAAGISDMQIQGRAQKQRVIEINSTLLLELGQNLNTVASFLDQQISARPAGNWKIGENQTELLTDTLDFSVEQLQQLLLPNPQGNPIRLGQVANIYDRYATRSDIVLFNGQPGIIFNIFRPTEQDSLQAAEDINLWIEEFLPRLLTWLSITAIKLFTSTVATGASG